MSHPQEFICPITQELMDDPVVGKDGHTYERKAITQWLQGNNRSPMTREPMTIADIKTNFALKNALDRYKTENNIVTTNSGQIRIQTFTSNPPNRNVKVVYNDTTFVMEAETNQPLDAILYLILDESGSMDSNATKSREAGPSFTRRQLVQHSSRVVANMLHSRDKTMLGILGFSSSARVILNCREIGKNDQGLEAANQAIDTIRASGGTNVWDGLRAGLAEVELVAKANPHANVQVVLLTDGEPSDPVDMILRNLTSRMRSLPPNITVNAFGFGYDLNTDLLDQICTIGRGIFGYIPDISMVGTGFINFCAYVLSTVMINMNIGGKHFQTIMEGTKYIQEHDGSFANSTYVKGDVASDQAMAIRMLLNVLEKTDPLQMKFQPVQEYIRTLEPNDLFLQDLLTDIENDDPNKGQLSKAISTSEYYRSWGKNHIAMYKHALQKKVCTNFKERALQHFQGTLFQMYQEIGNDLFASLPYPTPSNVSQEQLRTMNFSMTQFNTQDGGCFDGECIVHLQGGRYKKVMDIVKGDVLDNGSIIKCVVRSEIGRITKMIRFASGLLITPWHPIRTTGNTCNAEWVFPCYAHTKLELIHMEYFYDFVVEGAKQYVTINNWEVACLGHGMTDNEVISHPYYGTEAVLDVLSLKDGWNEGFIEL